MDSSTTQTVAIKSQPTVQATLDQPATLATQDTICRHQESALQELSPSALPTALQAPVEAVYLATRS